MFKVSTKGDYGLLLLSALAEKQSFSQRNGYVALSQIAKEKKLSLRYLSQLIIPLKRAGLVESKEGLHGGYRLAKNPGEITLMSILESLEGQIAPVKCMFKEKQKECCSEPFCSVQFVWQDAILMLTRYLRSKTLQDIISARNAPGNAVSFIRN